MIEATVGGAAESRLPPAAGSGVGSARVAVAEEDAVWVAARSVLGGCHDGAAELVARVAAGALNVGRATGVWSTTGSGAPVRRPEPLVAEPGSDGAGERLASARLSSG